MQKLGPAMYLGGHQLQGNDALNVLFPPPVDSSAKAVRKIRVPTAATVKFWGLYGGRMVVLGLLAGSFSLVNDYLRSFSTVEKSRNGAFAYIFLEHTPMTSRF